MVQCSQHAIPPAIEGRPHQLAGARSRPRAQSPAEHSADLPAARDQPHPLSDRGGRSPLAEMTYAFTSASNNNGSAFAGLSGNTQWFNTTLGLCFMIG